MISTNRGKRLRRITAACRQQGLLHRAALVAILTVSVTAVAVSSVHMAKDVVGSGGGPMTNSGITLNGTVGQSVVGIRSAAGDQVVLRSGFWQPASPTTGVPGEDIPLRPMLLGNAPNPFNPMTEIRFSVGPDAQRARLLVYDLHGRQIRTLLDEIVQPGVHRVTWHGRNDRGEQVASGQYFYRLIVGREAFTHKMMLVK
jgi:hypothetical protein